jgi:hypothetical protein
VSRRTLLQALVLASALASATGCYRYVPSQYAAVPQGENVRVWITADAKNKIEAEGSIPIGDPVLRGILAEKRSDGSMTLQVPITRRQEGFHSAPIYQNAALNQTDIVSVDRRIFDKTGTAALVAGTLGGTGVVIFLIMKAYGEPEGEVECEGDCSDLMSPVLPRVSSPGRRIPLFSIPIP